MQKTDKSPAPQFLFEQKLINPVGNILILPLAMRLRATIVQIKKLKRAIWHLWNLMLRPSAHTYLEWEMKKGNVVTRAPVLLTVNELATFLHVHPTTIYRLLKAHKLPAFRVGSDWRFNIEAIEKWTKEGR